MYDLDGMSANPATFFEQSIGHARSAIDETAFQMALGELDLELSPEEAKMVRHNNNKFEHEHVTSLDSFFCLICVRFVFPAIVLSFSHTAITQFPHFLSTLPTKVWLTATADGESVTAPSYASAAKRYPMTDKFKKEYLAMREADNEAERKALALEKKVAAEKAAAEKAAAEAKELEVRRAQAEKEAQLAAAATAESHTLDDVYEAFSLSLGGRFSSALGGASGSGSSSSSNSKLKKKKKKAPTPAAAIPSYEEGAPEDETEDLPSSPKAPTEKAMAPAFVSKILTKAQKELAAQGWLSLYLLMEKQQEERNLEEDEDGKLPLSFSDEPGAFFLVCLLGLSEEERLMEAENGFDAPPRYLDKVLRICQDRKREQDARDVSV